MDNNSLAHTKWECKYHLVFAPKYRRQVILKPTNISVFLETSIGARIYALMTVLKGVIEIEMLCLNSWENFEDNKRFLRTRMEEENPVGRKLLEKDKTIVSIVFRKIKIERVKKSL